MTPLVLLTAATALTLAGCAGMSPVGMAGANSAEFDALAKPGEIIVKFKTEAGRQALLQSLGLKTIKKVERINAIVVTGPDTKAALAKLSADPEVAYAEPNYVAKAFETTSQAPALGFEGVRGGDELLSKLWGMTKIEAPAAWEITRGKGARVAVVDTGIDHQHPDLAGRVAKGRDFVNDDDDAMDDQGHGTHCAGTIGAGLGNGGVVGVAPEVEMLAVKVLSRNGSGTYEGVANGIVYAADQGSHIISMSLGGPAGSKVIEDAVNYAKSKGALVVAAMGNENTESPSYPAAAPGVMAVGATTSADQRSSFSNYGKHISVGAPGSDIHSTIPGGKYATYSGTSMATPHTAGLVALVKSQNPGFNAAQLQAKVEQTADDLGAGGFDKYFGHGRINARKAVAQ